MTTSSVGPGGRFLFAIIYVSYVLPQNLKEHLKK